MDSDLEERPKTCPVCGQPPIDSEYSIDSEFDNTDWFRIKCKVCGTYEIDGGARACGLNQPEAKKRAHELSGLIRERSESGQILRVKSLQPDQLNELLSGLVPTTVQEKVDRFLQRLADKSEHPGHEIRIDVLNDFPWAYAKNAQEFGYYLRHVREAHLVDERSGYFLTALGWDRVEKLRESRATSSNVFVAMWFKKGDEELNALRSTIKNAIGAAGYAHPTIVDEERDIGRIDDFIIVSIREARFVVADFTGHRPNVYYEAGFARGLGTRVISLCREDQIDRDHGKESIGLQFDTRQYKHIPWTRDTLHELEDTLKWHIIDNFGRGPVKAASES